LAGYEDCEGNALFDGSVQEEISLARWFWERLLATALGHARETVKESVKGFRAMGEIFHNPVVALRLGLRCELSLLSADDLESAYSVTPEKNNHIFAGRKFRRAWNSLDHLTDGSAGLFYIDRRYMRSFELPIDRNRNDGGHRASIGSLLILYFFDTPPNDKIRLADESIEGESLDRAGLDNTRGHKTDET
jgi:hypothetical protein